MTTPSSGQPSHPQSPESAVDKAPLFSRSRWTRKLPGQTRRLSQAESVSLAWRIIAGGTRPGEAHGLLRAWVFWEQLARVLWPVYDVPGAPYGLLCLRITPYRGEALSLPDSTRIEPGTIIGELHCNNRAVLELVRQHGNPFAACRDELATLGNWIQHDARASEIQALYACTILTGAANRFGFTVREKPVTVRRRLEKFFFKGLLLLYSQEGLARLQHGSTATKFPADAWLSRGELLRLYYHSQRPGRAPARAARGKPVANAARLRPVNGIFN